MDTELVELLDSSGYENYDRVWKIITDDARKRRYLDGDSICDRIGDYIVDHLDDYFPGCVYIGTVGECRKSIAKMRGIQSGL